MEPLSGAMPVVARLGGTAVGPAYVVARQVVLQGPDRQYAFRDVALVAWHELPTTPWRHDELIRASIGCPDGALVECLVQVDADVIDPAGDQRIVKAVVIDPAPADALLEHLWPQWIARMPDLLRASQLLTTGRPLLYAAVPARQAPSVPDADAKPASRDRPRVR